MHLVHTYIANSAAAAAGVGNLMRAAQGRWLCTETPDQSYTMLTDSTIEQDNHCVKSMWGENHAHDIFVTLQIWLLVP